MLIFFSWWSAEGIWDLSSIPRREGGDTDHREGYVLSGRLENEIQVRSNFSTDYSKTSIRRLRLRFSFIFHFFLSDFGRITRVGCTSSRIQVKCLDYNLLHALSFSVFNEPLFLNTIPIATVSSFSSAVFPEEHVSCIGSFCAGDYIKKNGLSSGDVVALYQDECKQLVSKKDTYNALLLRYTSRLLFLFSHEKSKFWSRTWSPREFTWKIIPIHSLAT